MCYHDSEDLTENLQSHHYAERDDSELVVVLSHPDAEKLLVDWVNVNMEAGILHVESREPSPVGEEWDNNRHSHHVEFGFSDKGV